MRKWLARLPLAIQIVFVTFFFLGIGVGLFFLIKYFNYRISLPPAKLTEIVQASVAALGVLTLGSVAVVQYHKYHMDIDMSSSERFSKAISHLRDPNLAIRCGAMHEFHKLALSFPDDRKMILTVLTNFVQENIEKMPRIEDCLEKRAKPCDDTLLAAELLSILHTEFGNDFHARLSKLKGSNVDLKELILEGADLSSSDLHGADLWRANLKKAYLWRANLEGTNLCGTNLEGADLRDANLKNAYLERAFLGHANLKDACLESTDLRGVYRLTVEQLLDAIIDDTTLLDPGLRAEYDRLKAG